MTFIWYTPETRTLYEPRSLSQSRRVNPSEAVAPVVGAVPAVGQDRPERQKNQAYSDARQERSRATSARDIMSGPVVTLGTADLFSDAWRIVRQRKVRHIPILNAEGRPIGIIADRDLLSSLAELETAPGSTSLEQLMATPLERIMRTPLLTAEPTASIREVARVMFEERVGCIPVINENERLDGIVTRSDILRAVLNDAPLEFWV